MKPEYNLVETAKNLAHLAHKGQFRRDGVTPYIEHPTKVAEFVSHMGSSDYFSKKLETVAWLHDVLEDSNFTVKDLLEQGIPDVIVNAVEVLTRTDDCQEYDNYLQKVADNDLARKVKIADMICNLMDDPTEKQKLKYFHGLRILLD